MCTLLFFGFLLFLALIPVFEFFLFLLSSSFIDRLDFSILANFLIGSILLIGYLRRPLGSVFDVSIFGRRIIFGKFVIGFVCG
jgi:hypothetical protein